MLSDYVLKPLQAVDFPSVRGVYKDAIESQCTSDYSDEQIRSWASLSALPGILDTVLIEGKGWISVENNQIAAFAVRHPADRLALLYCCGRFARRGHASALLDRIEVDAREAGQSRLHTEASFLSYPLFLKRGWSFKMMEEIKISGVSFDRFSMEKSL